MAKHGIYFHGFASGPESTKGQLLQGYLNEHLDSFQFPDLNGDDFTNLRMQDWFDRARLALEAYSENDQILLCGSSLGAYTAAVLAATCARSQIGLLLIAPAFGFTKRWPHILGGESALAAWREQGHIPVYHYACEAERPLAYSFYESCQELIDYPTQLTCEISVVHGARDEVVDARMVDAFVQAHPHCHHYFMDDDHALLGADSQQRIRSEALRLVHTLG